LLKRFLYALRLCLLLENLSIFESDTFLPWLTYPCKNGDMDKLIIQGQGKTDYFPGLQAEVRAQTHCRMAFSVGHQGGFLEFRDLTLEGFGFLVRVMPVDSIQSIASRSFLKTSEKVPGLPNASSPATLPFIIKMAPTWESMRWKGFTYPLW